MQHDDADSLPPFSLSRMTTSIINVSAIRRREKDRDNESVPIRHNLASGLRDNIDARMRWVLNK